MIVHLAGTSINVAGRIIQRCAICGEKLCDSKNVAIPLEEDGTPGKFATWPVGGWIETEGSFSIVVGETETPTIEAYQIPSECCVELLE